MMIYAFGGLMLVVVVAAVVLAMAMGRNVAIICAVAGLMLIGLTLFEAQLSSRFEASNMTAQEFAKRFENVPITIGDWQGEDLEVTEEVRKAAGAVGYVSREYRNSRTGQRVRLWLIVGHSRDVCRHTPDVCYPSSGMRMQGANNSNYTMTFDGQTPANFWTNSFLREDISGRSLERVFWTWYEPDEEGGLEWEAPENQRWHFGNARALYKMYFSNAMPSATETADQSPCNAFAREFLPVLEEALVGDPTSTPKADSAEPANDAETTPADQTAA